MFERVSWLAEIVNVVLCLHFLYGQKIKSRAATGILLVADWFVMEVISQYSLSQVNVVIVYILIWVYTIIEFGNRIRAAILANVFWVIIISLLQLASSIPWVLLGRVEISDVEIFVTQCITMGLLVLLNKKIGLLYQRVLYSGVIAAVITGVFLCYIAVQIIQYKKQDVIEAEYFLPVVIFGVLVGGLAYGWQKEKEKREKNEIEMQVNRVCEASFRELIETIRMKQHDFYNHIHTLQSLHYTVGDYEELVKEQECYCADIKYDNRYYNLLNTRSPVISGFLYGKFMEADRQGIRIEYDVKPERLVAAVPEYVIIEMTGILWDNAVQCVSGQKDRRIKIILREYQEESKEKMSIAVENPVPGLSANDIPVMFRERYSTKSGHTGIGLWKIRQYTEKYPICLKAEREVYDEKEWLKIELEITN